MLDIRLEWMKERDQNERKKERKKSKKMIGFGAWTYHSSALLTEFA